MPWPRREPPQLARPPCSRPCVDDAPPKFIEGQLRAIVGVELLITRVEASFKLSQNRSTADIDGVIAGLLTDGHDDAARAVRLGANGMRST